MRYDKPEKEITPFYVKIVNIILSIYYVIFAEITQVFTTKSKGNIGNFKK